MDHAVVESEAMVAAGSLVTHGKVIKSGEIWAGRAKLDYPNWALTISQLDIFFPGRLKIGIRSAERQKMLEQAKLLE
ncbi:hypothetical protein TNIN_40311 [Trichonephila inaurata madagascariensis]|uniref:Uncharacterized protein n=1 Tax=Trichonephila inaurata madagascariensis TaxID=2747483 RepID=A0A8X6Y7G5_9ARAC|nr:hypothetical protein TNIN_40311 [Trichonephila inaurata madagascariensis]